jgi:O-antigen ligase
LLRLAAVSVIVALLAIPFAGAILSRLTDDDRGSTESRVQMIQVAKAIIADHPLLGVGLSSYEAVMRNYDETADLITEHFDWPVHNVYLQVAAEAGLPGLALFLALTGLALRSGWRVLRAPQADRQLRAMALGLLTGMFSYLVTALKEGSSFQSGQMRLFFLLCGLLFATEIAYRRSLAEREVEYLDIWEQSY